MSTRRTRPDAGPAGRLQKGLNNFNLCRYCQQECPAANRTFCSRECVHQWRLTSDTTYLRHCVKARDHGICASCGLDCLELQRVVWSLRHSDDVQPLWPEEMERARKWKGEQYRVMIVVEPLLCRLKFLGFDPKRKTFWDADHILEVVMGGGESGLDNIQTLCSPCHKAKTRELARRRAQARRNLPTTP